MKIYNFILILFLLFGCEVIPENKTLLTNNGCKFWRLSYFVSLKDHTTINKDFKVLQFCKSGKYLEYCVENEQLKEFEFTCHIPSRKWRFNKSEKAITLNDWPYHIKKLTTDSLLIIDKKEGRMLVFARYTIKKICTPG